MTTVPQHATAPQNGKPPEPRERSGATSREVHAVREHRTAHRSARKGMTLLLRDRADGTFLELREHPTTGAVRVAFCIPDASKRTGRRPIRFVMIDEADVAAVRDALDQHLTKRAKASAKPSRRNR